MAILKEVLLCAAAVFLIMIFSIFVSMGFDCLTEETWNDGMCPECSVRYELEAVSRGTKYYVCPDCGAEVMRH
jgi:predicted RNA-binding Zn-ribbon protein involved in translation (DUF1610 family)